MNTLSAGPGARSYGILLILLGFAALVLSRDIRLRSHTGEGDPGPRFMPRLMASGMIGGGAILVIGSFLRRRDQSPPEPRPPWRQAMRERGTIDVILLLVSLPIYMLAVSALGFFISTWVYSTAMMVRLRMRLPLAVLLATAMMIVVWLLFVWQFRVVLPRGPDWMPI